MNHVNYFRSLFESIEDYGKIVIFLFLIRNDNDFLTERGFWKDDINRLKKEFQKILFKQNEDYLDDIKNREESFIEKFSKK